jgi:hypothetical protein
MLEELQQTSSMKMQTKRVPNVQGSLF